MKDMTGRDLKNKTGHNITTFISWFDALAVEWN
jgi:hypothetical protein